MAVVRELVTVLAYKVDESGLAQYEAGFKQIKSMVLGLATTMGIALSAGAVVSYIEDLVDSGMELKKLRSQLENMARPIDDINKAMDRAGEIALEVGAPYQKIVETFKDFLQNSQDSTTTQEELLAAVENTQKAFRVDKVGKEEQDRFYALLERSDIIGKVTPRIIGMIKNTSLSAFSMLEQYYGKNEDGLREMAKDGKITAEDMYKAFKTPTKLLEERFAKLPVTVGVAFTNIRTLIMRNLVEPLVRSQKLSVLVGTAINKMAFAIVTAFREVIRVVGGLKNIIEVLGIALSLTLGPWLIKQLVLATAWTIRWAAASVVANWQWFLAAAAITTVALLIQDIYYWTQGKGSLIGDWLGDFEKLKKELDDKFGLLAIAETIEKVYTQISRVKDILYTLGSGDFLGAWKDAKQLWTDVKQLWDDIVNIDFKAVNDYLKDWIGLNVFGKHKDIWQSIENVMNNIDAFLKAWIVMPVFDGLKSGINTFWDKLKEIDNWMATSMIGKLLGYKGLFAGGDTPTSGATTTPTSAVPAVPVIPVMPATPPGGISLRLPRPANNNYMTTAPITNNITVTTSEERDIANTIRGEMDIISRNTVDAITRQIINSSPRTEAATQ
jgi:hypothetical protein